jgi:hypothetical protein
LYRDLQPGQNVYWNGFGDPPTLTYRAAFDDMEYNRKRQAARALVKVRLMGGNLGWIVAEDLELFACLYRKPLTNPSERQTQLLELLEREGPMNIGLMKEMTGLLVKEITPALHRLQEAFLIYEDQNEGQDDRAWYRFSEMFPNVDLIRYSRTDALKILLQRFAYRLVWFDAEMSKSYFKLSAKDMKSAIDALLFEGVLAERDGGYMLASDSDLSDNALVKSVFAMHRNDFLVKSHEHTLKGAYPHDYPDTLYYLLIDGEFHGAVAGKFRYSPEVSDVRLDLPPNEAAARKSEIIEAIKRLSSKEPEKYLGVRI